MKSCALSLFLALELSACSHISYKTPAATVYPPEVAAASTFHTSFKALPSRQQTVTEDASARPPVFDNKNEGATLLGADLNFGLTDQLQLTAGMTDIFGVYGRVQFQFLGRTIDDAQEGFSAAVFAETHFSSSTKSGDQNGQFGAGGYKWKANSSLASLGGGISAGYRWSRLLMGFVGVSANTMKIATKIDQEAGGTDPGGVYSQDNAGNSTSIGAGLVFGSRACRLVPTVQWVDYKMDSQSSHNILWGLTLEFGGQTRPPAEPADQVASR